jgi:RNA polymerase sigma-70 factor (TIGR02960 family)
MTRAQAGDGQAFRELTEPYRRELQVHCYRMLGSVQDAEDLVQETFLAAWRGLAGFQGRASLRAWLYRIATNRCLNARRETRRRPAAPVPPFEPPEPTRYREVTWLQPCPDALLEGTASSEPGPEARYQSREAIELGFIACLQQLPPRQAAVLVLRDVLGFHGGEVAGMLGTTEVAVKASLQRARTTMNQRRRSAGRPRPGPRASAGELARERAVARRFADAFQADDIGAVVGLLTDDAWLAMPPAPHEYQGPAAIASFLGASARWRAGHRFRLVPTRANARPAFGCYLDDPGTASAHATGLIALTFDDGQICAITRFLDDTILPAFGLPALLPGPA